MAAFGLGSTGSGTSFLGTLENDINSWISDGTTYVDNLTSAASGSPTVGTLTSDYGTWILIGGIAIAAYFLLK